MDYNYSYYQKRKEGDEKKKRGVLGILKLIFIPSSLPFRVIGRGIKYLFDLKLFKIIGRGLKILLDIITRPLIYPFLGLKNFFKTILAILAVIYFGLSIFVINDYLQNRYGEYQKYTCETKTEEKLKKSVVRIVGGYSEGSGFFIHANQVLTNFHVIDGEASPKIIFTDGTFITPVKIIGNQEVDLAILYTEKEYPDFVFYMPEKNIIGADEELIAAGYPMGTYINGPPTIVKGNYLELRKSRKDKIGYIQTDLSLVEGMSGGPLTNLCGDVVGINTISIGGQSLFIAADQAKTQVLNFTAQEITKIELAPTRSPEDAVYAFYTYLKTRQMKEGYDLLSSLYRQYATFEEWTNRFVDILDVQIISSLPYNKTKDTVYVKFWTKNWVNGEVDIHNYQGTWKTVIEDNKFKLNRSNIEEISEPDFMWYLE